MAWVYYLKNIMAMYKQQSIVYVKVVYDRKKKGGPKRDGAVEIRVTYRRKQKYLSTGVFCRPKNWKSEMVVGRLDAHQMNIKIDRMVRDVRWVVNQMQEEGRVDLDEIPHWLDDLCNGCEASMWDFFNKRKEARSYGKGKSVGYRLSYFLDYLRGLGYIHTWRDVTEENVIRMDRDLIAAGLKGSTRWYNYHRIFSYFIADAIREGFLPKNPYQDVKLCPDRDNDERLNHVLTREELERLRQVELPTLCLSQVRDVFLFQTYTCMSYVDMAAFDSSLLKEVGGQYVYMGKRAKTGKDFCFVLLPPAVEILQKYFGRLPIISNQRYNSYVKMVVQAAGIDKPVTTHWARHTGATLLLNAGVSMDVVAKVLGHSSTAITRKIYAKMLEETVVREMDKVRF